MNYPSAARMGSIPACAEVRRAGIVPYNVRPCMRDGHIIKVHIHGAVVRYIHINESGFPDRIFRHQVVVSDIRGDDLCHLYFLIPYTPEVC